MRLQVPWAKPSIPPTGEVIIQASTLTLRRARDVPAFLVAALRIRRTARRADGFAGLGLVADVRRRTFYTLSAWSDEMALLAYVASPVHRQVMRTFGPKMAGSHFVTWTSAHVDDSGAYPPRWTEAQQRLDIARQTEAA